MPKVKHSPAPQAAPPLSLVDFMRKERKESCPVCALPQAVREQLQAAPDKKIKLEKRLKWLVCLGYTKIQQQELTTHLNQRHDYA